MAKTILEVNNLKTHYFMDQGIVKAVDGVDLSIEETKTLGIVGESGCGKSVTARSILGLLGSRGNIVEGNIYLHDHGGKDSPIDMARLDPKGAEMREIRGKTISMIFQEPMTSLSPVHTIGNQIQEAILLHQDISKKDAKDLAIENLRKVGMPNSELRVEEYPHQLSGGMRQRAMIAMALSCRPKILIADEPTTAIDVTTQAQILELMKSLQESLGMAIMIITHNIGVIAEMADRVEVMYLGRIVESAPVRDLLRNPLHPYTKALLQSIPKVGKVVKSRLESIEGAVPDAYAIPAGCSFHPRCPKFKKGLCDAAIPEMWEPEENHRVRCVLFNE